MQLFLLQKRAVNPLHLFTLLESDDMHVRKAAGEAFQEWRESEGGRLFFQALVDFVYSENFIVRHLFDDAKYFLKAARFYERTNAHKARTYVRASITASFSALEALMNAWAEVLADKSHLPLHERAFLLEQRLDVSDDGRFELRGRRFYRVEQRMGFLYRKGMGMEPKTDPVWKEFKSAKKLRDKIMHPKPQHRSYPQLTTKSAEDALRTALRIASALLGPEARRVPWLQDVEPEMLDFERRSSSSPPL